MKKFLLSLLFSFLSLVNTVPSQENFITSEEVKKANSSSSTFNTEEDIKVTNPIRNLKLQSFDIRMVDFYQQEEMSLNFRFSKSAPVFAAYHFFLLNDDKEMFDVLAQGTLNVNDDLKEVNVKVNLNEINDIGNQYFIRIASTDIESLPFESIFNYIDVPFTNLWNFHMESNVEELITEVHFSGSCLRLQKEQVTVVGVEKENYEDIYYKFDLTDFNLSYVTKYNRTGSDLAARFMVYDENYIFNSAFIRYEKDKRYASGAAFFQSSNNKEAKRLCYSITYCVDLRTCMMASSRSLFSSYFRDNLSLYFPQNYYHIFKDARLCFNCIRFGAAKATISYEFVVHFAENFFSDYFYVSGGTGIKKWNGIMDEIEVWVVRLFSFLSC